MAQTAWSATGIGDFVDAALGYELITGDMNTLKESNWKVVERMFETALLCLLGVMNAGGGGKAVLCAVGKELGENMVMDIIYEEMEAGGCSEARSILNAVLIFRTVYSFVDAANSAVNARRFRDAYKDKDWDEWVKRADGTGKNGGVPEYPKGVVQGKSDTVVKGTLNGKLDGLTADERGMVEDLLSSGKNVEIIPRSNTSKTPDFFVDGVKTELKTLNGSSLNTPVTRIEDGFEQGAEIVIIDGRKTGLTLEQANIVIERALGKYNGEMPGIVEIWTNEGIIRR